MKWEWIRRIFVIGGVVYVLTLIPASIRPSWSAAPFRKPDTTITISTPDPGGVIPPGAQPRLKSACRSPWALRPLMGSAHHVRVIVMYRGVPAAVRTLDCELYAS